MTRLPALVLFTAFAAAATFLTQGTALAQQSAPPPPTEAPAPAAPASTTPAPAATTPEAAAPAPAPATPVAAAPADVPQTSDEAYGVKMRDLEDMVGELKEQIYRSKAKIQLLTQAVAGGAGAGARIFLQHKNEMGDNFLLTEANYFLDGRPLWQEVDETGIKLTAKKEYPLYDGPIVEGSHTLTVSLVYKGNGTGVFQYLEGYTFRLKDSITFTAEPGRIVSISAVGYEKGNFTTEMQDRPSIKFVNDSAVDPNAQKKPATAGTTP